MSKDESGAVIGMEGLLHLEGSVKATKLKLTWLPVTETLTPLRLFDFDHLITKKKPEEDDKIEDLVNPHSVRVRRLFLALTYHSSYAYITHTIKSCAIHRTPVNTTLRGRSQFVEWSFRDGIQG